MSQMRKRSSKECPSKRDAELRRSAVAARPGADAQVGRAQRDPSAHAARPRRVLGDLATRWPQRTSISGSAAIRSSRISSVRVCEMLTNGGNGELPGVGEGVGEQLAVAVEGARGRPGDALGGDLLARADRRPRCRARRAAGRWPSSRRGRGPGAGRAPPSARPSGPAAARSSARPARRRRRARARAASSSCLRAAGPDLPVPLGRPDHRPLDRRTARPTAATRRTAGSARRSASARTARAGRRGRRRTPPSACRRGPARRRPRAA